MKLGTLSVLAASAAITASTLTAAETAVSKNNTEKIKLPAYNECNPVTQTPFQSQVLPILEKRQSQRAFSSQELDQYTLSQILWAAAGINRPDGKRTAGSTRGWKSIDLYAVLNSGIYFYNAGENTLELIAEGNYQKLAGMQPFVATAPLNLLFVGDTKKMAIEDKVSQHLMFGTDIGLMSQNVYLYAAEKGLATVVRGSVEHAPLAKIMNLPPEKVILMAQTVGYPAPKKPLVVYYSWSGNTREAAKIIAETIDADLFEIKTKVPYPEKYEDCIKAVKEQNAKGILPELENPECDFSKYGDVVLASPNWWGTLPPPVQSFIKANSFKGTTPALFITNGGGGLQNCAQTATELIGAAPCATNNIQGAKVRFSKEIITNWAKTISGKRQLTAD